MFNRMMTSKDSGESSRKSIDRSLRVENFTQDVSVAVRKWGLSEGPQYNRLTVE